MQRTLHLSFDNLVIGSDMSAFAYCYVHHCPAIYLRVLSPYKYNEYETYDSDKSLWNDLAYALSNSELLPFGDKIVSLRLEDNNILKAITKQSVVLTIKYNTLIISDDYKLEGLPPPIGKTSDKNWVIDWFNVKHGMLHSLQQINDFHNEFVKKIIFFVSDRFYKNARKKDCLSLSKISDTELASGEYDENIARLKTLNMMKEAGIKGVWDITNERFVKPKLFSVKRDVYPLGKNLYQEIPNIKFLYESADTILKTDFDRTRWKKYGINR